MAGRRVPFFKGEGFGNDFIVLPERELAAFAPDPGALARQVCSRNFSLGADGVVTWLPGEEPDLFYARIFNADGSEAGVSGNGFRILAAALHHEGLLPAGRLRLRTAGGPKELVLTREDGLRFDFQLNLGEPVFEPAGIPMIVPGEAPVPVCRFPLEALEATWPVTALSVGNPHAVIRHDDFDPALVLRWGSLLENHPAFPERANVEFVQVIDAGTIRIGIWERGVGHTLASGTGSAAAAVACILNGWTGREVEVRMEGGRTRVRWGAGGPVLQEGSARLVCRGDLFLDRPGGAPVAG